MIELDENSRLYSPSQTEIIREFDRQLFHDCR
jgi:hypothetical protein